MRFLRLLRKVFDQISRIFGWKGENNMGVKNQAVLDKIAAIQTRVLAIQAELAASGMSSADELEVDAALDHLKTVVDPAVPNPPDVPADPGGTPTP